ncbi:MAG: phosphotransferase family protein [Alphaproteobacteria bacterium]
MTTLPEAPADRLAPWLAEALGGAVTVTGLARLEGGAIQENWALDVEVDGAPQAWVLRTDATSGVAMSWGKVEEYRILEVVHRAGVTVPAPIALCPDARVLGRPFYVMSRHPGEARARVLARDPKIGHWGPPLARRLAAELARLHSLTAPVAGLDFLPLPAQPAAFRVAAYRDHLAALGVTNPVLDLALDVLAERAPATPRRTLVHADFRLGNVLVDRGELSAVLDWEFAAYSDPLEDLGWFLGRYWRFGRWRVEAGGLASKAAFVDAYEAAAATAVEPRALRYWQLMGTVRWAVIALQQAARHYVAQEPSLELALTGAVLPQLEWDILDLIEALDGDR